MITQQTMWMHQTLSSPRPQDSDHRREVLPIKELALMLARNAAIVELQHCQAGKQAFKHEQDMSWSMPTSHAAESGLAYMSNELSNS